MHVPSSKCDAPSPKKNQFFLVGYLNIITKEIQTKTSFLPISVSQEDTILYGSMPSNWNRVRRNELIKLLSSVFYLNIRLKYLAPPKSKKGTRINTVCIVTFKRHCVMVKQNSKVEFSCSLNLPKLSCASMHFSMKQAHVIEYIPRQGEAAARQVLGFATVTYLRNVFRRQKVQLLQCCSNFLAYFSI